MSDTHIRALRILHRTFRHHSPAQRLHILGRYFSAPLLRTIAFVPQGARVLDVGAGHGLWARLIVEERARSVVAMEPDLRKIMRLRHAAVRAVAGEIACIRGAFDVVAVLDVFYLMRSSARDELLRSALERLRPGGLLLVKDLDPRARLKDAWDRLQETLAVRVLHLSRGQGVFAHDTPEEMDARLQRAGFANVEWRRIDAWYPHAHIVYTAQ